jgi:hypothetical protein
VTLQMSLSQGKMRQPGLLRMRLLVGYIADYHSLLQGNSHIVAVSVTGVSPNHDATMTKREQCPVPCSDFVHCTEPLKRWQHSAEQGIL